MVSSFFYFCWSGSQPNPFPGSVGKVLARDEGSARKHVARSQGVG